MMTTTDKPKPKEPEIRNPHYSGATPGMVARALAKRKPAPIKQKTTPTAAAQSRV